MGTKASIGVYLFHTFEFPETVPNYDHGIEVLEQAGVDNADFRRLAKHSKEFEIFTEWNTSNEVSAWATFGNYTSLVGLGPQQLIMDPGAAVGIRKDFDADNLRLKILEVQAGGGGLQPVRRVGCITGGVNPNGFNTVLAATWRVKWVDVTPPP